MQACVTHPNNNRLIVLLPHSLANNISLAHKIHWMALRDCCDVVYVSIVDDPDDSLTISRYLATLAAVTADYHLNASWKLIDAAHWLAALGEIYRPGDGIYCHENHTVKAGLFKTVPLHEYLVDSLACPVDTFSGYDLPRSVSHQSWYAGLMAWLGFLVIMAGFSWLEIEMDLSLAGAGGKLMVFFVLCIELWALWTWHKRFS